MSDPEQDLNTIGQQTCSEASQVDAARRLGEVADELELNALLSIASHADLAAPVASAVGVALATASLRLEVNLDARLANLQSEVYDAFDEAMSHGLEAGSDSS